MNKELRERVKEELEKENKGDGVEEKEIS